MRQTSALRPRINSRHAIYSTFMYTNAGQFRTKSTHLSTTAELVSDINTDLDYILHQLSQMGYMDDPSKRAG